MEALLLIFGAVFLFFLFKKRKKRKDKDQYVLVQERQTVVKNHLVKVPKKKR